ncbi:MAG: NgoFVII family restriction endonuclease [Lachnospiraceae bacterium]|nr:NgoFVII family restriction endonuclease [Lachnospiraceae bacterium]
MPVSFDNLKNIVLENAKSSDEIIVISGYFSLDMLETLARTGKKISFYYGMYLRSGLSQANMDGFKRLASTYSNLEIKIPFSYHVHTKCYIFRSSGITLRVLAGSANCSGAALDTTPNSELLTDNFIDGDILAMEQYAADIDAVSIPFSDPAIKTSVAAKVQAPARARVKRPKSWQTFTGNPFSANLALYHMNNGKPEVHNGDGLNWGLGSAHHSSNGPYAEACIPIRAYDIDTYPTLIPCQGSCGSGSGGKITRRQSSIEVLWDDGTVMEMHFEGNGPVRPIQKERKPGEPLFEYPKQLTSSNGGAVLGEYLRKRLNVGGRVPITYKPKSRITCI